MPTTIDGLRFTPATRRHDRKSALRLADEAARGCLDDAGVAAHDVDLLINTGLYRDDNLGEPALAALIQEDVGINPEDPHGHEHGTFSFDLANGACGVLSALQVVDGFLRAGTITRALVVASDADPGHGLAPTFPFAPAGAAMLCCHHPDGAGLQEFHWQRRPDEADLFHAVVRPEGHRNLLRFHADGALAERLAALAAHVAIRALGAGGLAPDDISVVVAAPSDPSFVAAFAAATGIAADRIVVAAQAALHTVAFPAALDVAVQTGRFAPGTTALFVCAGAGLTAGACLYRS
jgi:3-oxoacyl-[acyl-carrier-protein] synthase-3